MTTRKSFIPVTLSLKVSDCCGTRYKTAYVSDKERHHLCNKCKKGCQTTTTSVLLGAQIAPGIFRPNHNIMSQMGWETFPDNVMAKYHYYPLRMIQAKRDYERRNTTNTR